jgi:HEAT repeat protein
MLAFAGTLEEHGIEMARMRAAFALGAFDTPESIEALDAGLGDGIIGSSCAAALYRLSGDESYLGQLDSGLKPEEDFYSEMLADYLTDRVGTDAASVAADRIRGG